MHTMKGTNSTHIQHEHVPENQRGLIPGDGAISTPPTHGNRFSSIIITVTSVSA